MARSSRYQESPPFTAADAVTPAFAGLRPRRITPATPVLEHRVTAMDRLDLLAIHYYNDPRLWWRILDANPELLCGADLADPARIGSVILIPAAEEAGSPR